MKLINQNAEFIKQEPGIEGIYKIIELAGRTSYLSWDKMTDDSARKFVDMLIKSKHMSCLEHGTVYLRVGKYTWDGLFSHIDDYRENPYSNVNSDRNGDYYITTNLRVLQENGWLDDLQYLCEPTEFHEKRLSVRVVTSRSISHELVRHRSMSFIQESQRYVGYDKDRFGGEITYIIPNWLEYNIEPNVYHRTYNLDGSIKKTNFGFVGENEAFLDSLCRSEHCYMSLLSMGFKPQQAREVLPNATKTTLVITAFESDWREWFAQRYFGKTGQPHPDMIVLANLIKDEFEKAGVWEGIMKYPSKYENLL